MYLEETKRERTEKSSEYIMFSVLFALIPFQLYIW